MYLVRVLSHSLFGVHVVTERRRMQLQAKRWLRTAGQPTSLMWRLCPNSRRRLKLRVDCAEPMCYEGEYVLAYISSALKPKWSFLAVRYRWDTARWKVNAGDYHILLSSTERNKPYVELSTNRTTAEKQCSYCKYKSSWVRSNTRGWSACICLSAVDSNVDAPKRPKFAI